MYKMHQTSVIFLAIIIVQSIQFLLIYAQSNDAFEEEQNNELKAVYHGAPRIHPFQGEIELEKGENLTLECESEDHVTWRVVNHNDNSERYAIKHLKSGDLDRPFKSTIDINSASASDVQRFYCVKNETLYEEDVENELDYDDAVLQFQASSIYIFVKDPEQLLVPISIPFGHVQQYEEAFIPCKPSSKSTNVVLTKDESEIPIENYHYSPMLGFIIRIQSVMDGGLYKCTTDDADGQAEESYHLEVSETSLTQYISKPKIFCNTSDHATVGGELDMRCDVEVAVGAKFSIDWYLPNKKPVKNDHRIHISELSTKAHPAKKNILIGSRTIKIFGVSQEIDNGVFKCEVQDLSGNKNHNYHAIKVLDTGTGFVDLYEESNLTQIIESTKRREWAKIVIRYKAFPEAQFAWFRNHNEDIFENTTKYEITKTDKDVTLTIHQLNINDTGNYTLKALNEYAEAVYTMQVLVKDKPQVSMESIYSKPNKQVSFKCNCAGYPESKMAMFFTPCHADPKWPTCTSSTRAVDNSTVSMTVRSIQSQIAEYPMIALTPGKVYCFAENSEGKSNISAELLIGNQEEPVTITIDQPENVITTGDDVTVTCSALIYFHTPNIEWRTNNNEVIGNTSETTVINTVSADSYAYESKLIFKNIQESNKGFYKCKAFDNNGTIEEKDIEIDVMEPIIPKILSVVQLETIKVEIGDAVLLNCDATGTPAPKIAWYKNDELIEFELNDTYRNQNELFFQFSRINDTANYRCIALNKVGQASKEWNMEVLNSGAISKFWIYLILTIILLLVILITFITLRLVRARKYLREMKAAGLANFEEGDPDAINPEIGLDEQADLLPYKSEFEFPREKLKMGKQLGAGAFGIVMKATAEGIKPYEDETICAVKMVKKQTDNEVMRALISELKIMVHLGHNLNVVNLLGAVTKNIAKREVMVIVEYCRFGNVQNFLLKHRAYYIDQINSDTGEIDHNIQKNELRWSKSGYQYNRNSTKSEQEHMNTKGYLRQSGMHNLGMIDSAGTEATLVSYVGGEDTIPCENSTEPAWRSNYRMDYKGPVRSVTTTDLVSWAAQVASGMDYLASRKVLHGDLAARNILLSDDNVVKICDFGLARSMYKTSNYKKKSESPLPFKWLALECISDSVFSTYSDIWAYGIVLWELFSLAKIPYPGMEANEQLYQKLRDGYRMEKPQFANQDIYDIMLNCWNVKPDTRPSFKDLKSRFEAMLPDELRNHYLDLNEPYLAMNAANIEKGDIDYLANLGPPDEKAPSVPDYVNGIILPLPPISEYQNSSDYLKMSSPKQDSESNFDFGAFNQRTSPTLKNNLDNSPHNTKRHKKAGLPEEIPMLNTSNISNSDSEPEMSPKPAARVSQTPEFQQTNQYVNVKPVRDAFANPSYITFNKVNEKNG